MRNREQDAPLYCLSTISVLLLFLTVPWVGLKYVIVILPDHTRYHFNESVHQSLILITIEQSRPHICAVSPGPLKIALKSWGVDEGSANFNGQFNNVWY